MNLLYFLSFVLILIPKINAVEKITCPVGFDMAYDEINSNHICYRQKSLEIFQDKYKNCSGNFYSFELYQRLNITKTKSKLWTDFISLYPGGPFVNYKYGDDEPEILFEISNLSTIDNSKDMCLIRDEDDYVAVDCDEKHNRYCFMKPYSVKADWEKCDQVEVSHKFYNPEEVCLMNFTVTPGLTLLQAKELCKSKNSSLLSQGWIYANMLVFNKSSIYPLDEKFGDADGSVTTLDNLEKIVAGCTLNWQGNNTSLWALQNGVIQSVDQNHTFLDIVCQRSFNYNVTLNLSVNLKNQIILSVDDNLDESDIYCFTDSLTYRPSKIKTKYVNHGNIYLLLPIDDGYYWCFHIHSRTMKKSFSNQVLFIKQGHRLWQTYAVKMYVNEYIVGNIDANKFDWKNKLAEYIIYCTKDKRIDEDFEITKNNKEFNVTTKSNKVVKSFKIKRLYLDKRTMIVHIDLNPDIIPHSCGVWDDIEVVYMRPVYIAGKFDDNNTCKGNFNEGMLCYYTNKKGTSTLSEDFLYDGIQEEIMENYEVSDLMSEICDNCQLYKINSLEIGDTTYETPSIEASPLDKKLNALKYNNFRSEQPTTIPPANIFLPTIIDTTILNTNSMTKDIKAISESKGTTTEFYATSTQTFLVIPTTRNYFNTKEDTSNTESYVGIELRTLDPTSTVESTVRLMRIDTVNPTTLEGIDTTLSIESTTTTTMLDAITTTTEIIPTTSEIMTIIESCQMDPNIPDTTVPTDGITIEVSTTDTSTTETTLTTKCTTTEISKTYTSTTATTTPTEDTTREVSPTYTHTTETTLKTETTTTENYTTDTFTTDTIEPTKGTIADDYMADNSTAETNLTTETPTSENYTPTTDTIEPAEGPITDNYTADTSTTETTLTPEPTTTENYTTDNPTTDTIETSEGTTTENYTTDASTTESTITTESTTVTGTSTPIPIVTSDFNDTTTYITTEHIITPMPEDVIEQILEDLEQLLQDETAPILIEDIIDTFDQVNNLLNEDQGVVFPGELLQLLEQVGERVDLNGSLTATVVGENIAMLMADAGPENPVLGISVAARDTEEFAEDSFAFYTEFQDQLTANKTEAAVFLPPSLTSQARRISFIVYRNDRAFNDSNGVYAVNSRVISVSVANFAGFERGEVVNIHTRPRIPDPGRNISRGCAYWRFLNDASGFWSQDGCSFVRSRDPETLDICQCNHLTHFAEILIPRPVFSQTNEDILEILSVVGCSVSILGLLIIILTSILFKSWRANFLNQIWLQLCISLFIMMICFIIVVFAGFDGYGVFCMSTGITLHYSLLASFSWMLVVAIKSFRDLVLIFSRQVPHKLVAASTFAWGLPLVVLGILLIVDPLSYFNRFEEINPSSNFCYPSGLALWLSVYAPVVAMLVANCVLFALIVHNIGIAPKNLRYQRAGDKREALNCARISFVLVFFFGLPWLFGLFAYNIVAAYFFTCTATLQGFFLFVFIVLGNLETRNLWLLKLRPRKL